jgi:flagellar biosynthesis protein FlhB
MTISQIGNSHTLKRIFKLTQLSNMGKSTVFSMIVAVIGSLSFHRCFKTIYQCTKCLLLQFMTLPGSPA